VHPERGQHVDLEREAGAARVHARVDAGDHALLLQAPDAVERRGGGESDDPRELDVRAVGVLLELAQEPDVNFVKLDGHLTK
jgi:hypothetical protein